MSLPTPQELLKHFSSFLIEAGLSAVSVKNYLSDIRHFLNFTNNILPETPSPTPETVFQNLSKYVELYTEYQRSIFAPTNSINRRLASIRRFSTFLSAKFRTPEGLTHQNISTNSDIKLSGLLPSTPLTTSTIDTDPIQKILSRFRTYLENQKKSHSTVKNYLSDLNHFLHWSDKDIPFTIETLDKIVSENQLSAYVNYQKLSQASSSLIARRQSSVKTFAKFCASEKYINKNPFEITPTVAPLTPFSWLERFTKRQKSVPVRENNLPPSRIKQIYKKYNELPFTPYLHLAILVLATSAMAIFAYNQIISAAFPAQATTSLLRPARQLSFQGHLTDSGGTPITTPTDVIFRLYDNLTGPTELYTSTTCSIDPDDEGVFNTLIGDTVCGAEIPASVFSDNRDVFIEVQVGAETLTPRQQIATVGFALNSETLQGYPASPSATENTVPVMNNDGDILLGSFSPDIISSSGTFNLEGQTLTLTTTVGSGGNIILQPDTAGAGNVQILTSSATGDQLRIQNANLTNGTLISGYIGNTNDKPGLLVLSSGSSETEKFAVRADGQTRITTDATLGDSAMIINQLGSGDVLSASVSGASKFVVKNSGFVGVGTTTPNSMLHIQNTTGGTFELGRNDATVVTGDSLGKIQWTGNDSSWTNSTVAGSIELISESATATNPRGQLVFSTSRGVVGANEEAMRIDYQGFVGIGTTTPSQELTVAGDLYVTGGYYDSSGDIGSSGQILTSTATGTNWSAASALNYWQRNAGALTPLEITNSLNLGATATASALVHLAGTAGDNSFVNTGNFGVGTTNPTTSLHVGYAGSSILTLERIDTSVSANDPVGKIQFYAKDTSTTTNNIIADIEAQATNTISSNINPGRLIFRTTSTSVGASPAERMRIDEGGNVGIGTTNPGANLEIGTTTTTADTIVRALAGDGYNAGFEAYGSSQGTGYLFVGQQPAYGGGIFYNGDGTPAFATGETADNISFYRKSAGVSEVVFSYPQNSNQVAFRGNITVSGTGTNTFAGDSNFDSNTLFVDNSANSVGIGLTNPSTTLHVLGNGTIQQTSANQTAVLSLQGTGDGNAAYLHLNDSDSNISWYLENRSSDTNAFFIENYDGTNWTQPIKIEDSTPTNTLYLASTGYVGIGDPTPDAALDVVGDIYVSGGISLFETSVTDGTVEATQFCTGDGETNCVTDFSSIITGAGYWSRTSGALYPSQITNSLNLGATATASAYVHLAGTAGDNSFVNTGNFGVGTTAPTTYKLQVVGTGGFSSTLTASNGLTLTTGALNLTATSGALTLSGLTASSINTGANNITFTSGNFNTTATGINSTNIGATTPGTGAFTTLSSTGVTTIGNNSATVAIDSSDWNINATGDMSNIGAIGMNGAITGATGYNGLVVTANTGVITTGTWNASLIGLTYGGTNKNMTPINGGIVWTDADSMEVTAAGSSGQVLVSNGAAAPSWSAASAVNFWQRNAGALTPLEITNSVNIGATATASALVHLAGTAGDNSFINTGSFGIGDTTPSYPLDVTGEIRSTSNIYANDKIITSRYGHAGTYLSTEVQGIWSIGDAWQIDTVADTFGNLYGMGYAYNYNGGAPFSSHQIVFTNGGTINAAIGLDGKGYFAGSVGIGDATPDAPLDVVGDVYISDGLSLYETPVSDGTIEATKFCTGDGEVAADCVTSFDAINLWQRTAGSLAPRHITDSINIGSTATASAYVHLAGTAGENSFVNTGNFGIGTTTPTSYKLDVSGTGRFSSTSNPGLVVGDGATGYLKVGSTGWYDDGSYFSPSGTRNLYIRSTTPATYFYSPNNYFGVNSVSHVQFGDSDTYINDVDFYLDDGTTYKEIGIFSAATQVGQIYTNSADDLIINNPTADLVLQPTGNVGIGTTAPGSKLDVAGTTGTAIGITGTGFTTDINLQNGETIDNDTNGTINLTSTILSLTGTTTLTASSLATLTTSATVAWGGATTLTFTSDNATINGSDAANGNLTLQGTTNATRTTSYVILQPTAGNVGIGVAAPAQKLQVAGVIAPSVSNTHNLGTATLSWGGIYIGDAGINQGGAQIIDITNRKLANGDWEVEAGKFTVSLSGPDTANDIVLDPNATAGATITVGGGTGKIDVGTVDPPYTINGEKFSTYFSSMVGLKEETTGNVATSEYVDGVGYRHVMDILHQPQGSDLWVFTKTSNLNINLDKLSVLLTAQSQAKVWYEIDLQKDLVIFYSSSPTTISYRMTSPRFDYEKWTTKTPHRTSPGFILTNPDTPIDPNGTILPVYNAQIVKQSDNLYVLNANGREIQEVGGFFRVLIANLEAGMARVSEIVADNITVNQKLISPLAEIDYLESIDATISGTLYANNIEGNTVNSLNDQISDLSGQYSTASAILADLQAKYGNYDSLLAQATSSANPLNVADLGTPTASIPADLVLNSVATQSLIAQDAQINGTLLSNSLNSLGSDLYIQPDGNHPVHLLADLMTLHPDGKVVINGDLLLSGTLYAQAIDTKEATISGKLALGNPTTSSSPDQVLSVYNPEGSLVSSVNDTGSADFNQVATNQLIIAAGENSTDATSSGSTSSNATIGTATLPSGQTEIFIANTKMDNNTLVYLTPVSDTKNQVLYVKSKQEAIGFTVAVGSNNNNQDIQFNYWLVKTK